MLKKSEIEQLGFEIARDRHGAEDRNEAYHAHITNGWAKARGGMEMGAWDAWCRGWERGIKARGAS